MNVLEQRAARLAAAAKRDAEVAVVELLRFRIGDERYAIETNYLHAVLRIEKVGFVPSAPRHLIGIINFQGDIVPFFDAGKLWSAQSPASAAARKAVILGRDLAEFAIAVDEADEIEALPATEIPRDLTQDQFVLRVLSDGCAVLDAAAMLDSPQFVYGEQHERKP